MAHPAVPEAPLPLVTDRNRTAPHRRPYPELTFAPDPQLPARVRHVTTGLMARLRQWRVEQGLSREALAALTQIPVAAIKRGERTGQIPFARVVAIALTLGLAAELADLFIQRRLGVPSLVLGARSRRRVRGWTATRRRGRA